MAPLRTNNRHPEATRPQLVARPTECARIGPALRIAYTHESLPGDMMASLDRLDQLTRAH